MTTAEEIKEKLGIAEVVGSYIALQKAGVNLRAKCPFHKEKTPSFFVSPTRGSFYCFGCGAKGDVFSFVEQFEGLDFKGALRVLAERAGVPLRFDREGSDERDRLFALMEAAAMFFEEKLEEKPEAVRYLRERGLRSETASAWRVGYAPLAWRDTVEYLRLRGFTDKEIAQSGMGKQTEKGIYDRFRGRIMFPLMDPSGRIVAFSGRMFDPPGDIAGKEPAKYVNSPETPLFSKSRTLYGYHKAKGSIRKNDFSIVVEGQMDLLLSHQAGYTNTVALSGTALTSEQIELLHRLSGNIVFALDSDRAGEASSKKSHEEALAKDMDVKVALLPEGEDPADVIRKDPEAWKGIIRESKHVIEYVLSRIVAREQDHRKRASEVAAILPDYISKIPSAINQAHFVDMVASRLGIPHEAIWSDVKKKSVTAPGGAERPREASKEGKTRKGLILSRLLSLLLLGEENPSLGIDSAKLRERLSELLGDGELRGLLEEVKRNHGTLLFEAERAGVLPGATLAEESAELLQSLEGEVLSERYAHALSALKEAEAEGKQEEAGQILGTLKEISERLRALGEASHP